MREDGEWEGEAMLERSEGERRVRGEKERGGQRTERREGVREGGEGQEKTQKKRQAREGAKEGAEEGAKEEASKRKTQRKRQARERRRGRGRGNRQYLVGTFANGPNPDSLLPLPPPPTPPQYLPQPRLLTVTQWRFMPHAVCLFLRQMPPVLN